jgi:hypothetical protein
MRRVGIALFIAGLLPLIYGLFVFDLLSNVSKVVDASGGGKQGGLEAEVQRDKFRFVTAGVVIMVLGLGLCFLPTRRATAKDADQVSNRADRKGSRRDDNDDEDPHARAAPREQP